MPAGPDHNPYERRRRRVPSMTHVSVVLVATLFATVLLAGCHDTDGDGTSVDPGDNIDVNPDAQITGVNVTSLPPSAAQGGSALVCWAVEGRGTIPHTAIHFDNETHPGANVEFGAYDSGFSYPGNQTQQDPDGYEIPRTFCTEIPVGDETVYFRAHAMITAPGLLSQEHSIAVTSG